MDRPLTGAFGGPSWPEVGLVYGPDPQALHLLLGLLELDAPEVLGGLKKAGLRRHSPHPPTASIFRLSSSHKDQPVLPRGLLLSLACTGRRGKVAGAGSSLSETTETAVTAPSSSSSPPQLCGRQEDWTGLQAPRPPAAPLEGSERAIAA